MRRNALRLLTLYGLCGKALHHRYFACEWTAL